MKNPTNVVLFAVWLLACDESKYDKYKTVADAASVNSQADPSAAASLAERAPAPAPTTTRKTAADCKPHPAAVEFDDAPLEAEVRRKLGKDAGAISPADLAQIKSINLVSARIHQIDPCIFPMLTSLKDLFLGPGDYDDLLPLQKLTTLEALRVSLSQVKDLHALEGLKRMDRLDLSDTLVGDEGMKSVGSLVNLTELMLDGDAVSDLTPLANLKKLERLSIKKTGVTSLAPLAQTKTLKFLYIADTPISDTAPIQPLLSGGLHLIRK